MKIVVNLQIEGIHRWRECPIEEVGFIRNSHRHIFHICCKKKVSHNDRDIEIISFKHDIQDFLEKYWHNFCRCYYFGHRSCEMIAEELYRKFNLDYCSVLEDGENGAEISKEDESRENFVRKNKRK